MAASSGRSELAKFEQEKEDARIAIENREDLVTDYVQINYHSATQIFSADRAKGIGGGVVAAMAVAAVRRRKTVVSCPRAAVSWPTSAPTR